MHTHIFLDIYFFAFTLEAAAAGLSHTLKESQEGK